MLGKETDVIVKSGAVVMEQSEMSSSLDQNEDSYLTPEVMIFASKVNEKSFHLYILHYIQFTTSKMFL